MESKTVGFDVEVRTLAGERVAPFVGFGRVKFWWKRTSLVPPQGEEGIPFEIASPDTHGPLACWEEVCLVFLGFEPEVMARILERDYDSLEFALHALASRRRRYPGTRGPTSVTWCRASSTWVGTRAGRPVLRGAGGRHAVLGLGGREGG
ncbi:MAG: hypothetical protein GXO28_00520 [Methanopyri archaeon]|nr:hypothetical protein [Methanopyri archaeon]